MEHLSDNLVIACHALGRESALVRSFMELGPDGLRKNLDVSLEDFKVIFDYLVFNCDLLKVCMYGNLAFLRQKYMKHGVNHVREMLGVLDEEYDEIWRDAYEVLSKGIAGAGLEGFFLVYNAMRTQRRIDGSGLL